MLNEEQKSLIECVEKMLSELFVMLYVMFYRILVQMHSEQCYPLGGNHYLPFSAYMSSGSCLIFVELVFLIYTLSYKNTAR